MLIKNKYIVFFLILNSYLILFSKNINSKNIVEFQNNLEKDIPDCRGKEQWPAKMAFVYLKNSLLTSNKKIDFSKTKIVRIASEKVGVDKYNNENLHRQVHHITFYENTEKKYLSLQ